MTKSFLNNERIGSRKIVIWGAGCIGKEMVDILRKYNYDIECFVDSNAARFGEQKLCDLPVREIDFLRGGMDKYYVVVAIVDYHAEIKEYLYAEKYIETQDYFWFNRTFIEADVTDGYYCDDFGNCVEAECFKNLTVRLQGRNNSIKIDKNSLIYESAVIKAIYGAKIIIDNCRMIGHCYITVDRSTLTINNGSHMENGEINISGTSELTISSSDIADKTSIAVSDKSKIIITNSVIGGKLSVLALSAVEVIRSYICDSKITLLRNSILNMDNSYIARKCDFTIANHSDVYLDGSAFDHDNKITVSTGSDIKIFGSQIKCSGDIICTKKSHIILNNDYIADYFLVKCYEMSKLELNGSDIKHNCEILSHHNSEILIEQNNRIGTYAYMISDHESKIFIGADGGFANNVTILSGDSHPVFNINNPQKYRARGYVEIKNHTWLGKGCTVLSGTVIGESSIVAPNSVTARSYPNNCLIMGYPARAVKYDITFDFDVTDPDMLDKRYWNRTEDD